MPGLWTEPHDWATNEFTTATLLDTHLKDNMRAVTRAGDATGLSPTTTAAEIISSAAELSMRNAAAASNTTGWQIPAGIIGTTRMVKLITHGDFLYNLAGSPTLRLRIYLRDGSGVNTLLHDSTIGGTANTNAGRQPWDMEVNVAALGSATSQIMWGHLFFNKPAAGSPTSGIGAGFAFEASGMEGGVFADDAASASDMSAARYLDVTGTWSSASASLAWRLKYATLVLL